MEDPLEDRPPAYTRTQEEWYFCCPGDGCPFPGARKYCLGFLWGVHTFCLGALFCHSPPNPKDSDKPVSWVFEVLLLLFISLMIMIHFLQIPGILPVLAIYGGVLVIIIFGASGFEFPAKLIENTGLFVATLAVCFWIGFFIDYEFDFSNSVLDRHCAPAPRRETTRRRGETEALLV
ncbi:hypothetical protein F4776DRAFT_232079 [Hypoxylon sp. NC0597]|nr:hypothetical protein F4776DRAFT_232079 [Hypoxylon sp. NC0597]